LLDAATQAVRREKETDMLMRFFDALRIGPTARKIMGWLFTALMLPLYIWLSAWLRAIFPLW